MNEAVITPDIERFMQAYDTLHDPPTAQTGDDVKLSLKNASPTDIPQLEENLCHNWKGMIPLVKPEKQMLVMCIR